MKTVLITGASSGIGKEFAYKMAKDKFNLILVARRKELLEQIANELKSQQGVEVDIVAMDLSEQGSAQKLYDWVKSQNKQVDILINNAGFGDLDYLSIKKLQKYQKMINLNMLALTELTVLFAEDMKKNNNGQIVNVASTAAFLPIPYFSVYAATKAYVLSFSEAIHYELKPFGIKVSVVCPGPTDTEFSKTSDIKVNQMFDSQKNGMTAQQVVDIAYPKILKGKMTIITGLANKINVKLASLVPTRCLLPKIMEKQFKKLLKN